MAILSNQGTLLYTPQGGTQSSVVSNITATELNVTYGLEVTHAATPSTFVTGDSISYTVLLRNTGTGTLYNPFVTVETGGALDYQEGSATAYLYANGAVSAVPVTVIQNSPITFAFGDVLPTGGLIYLNYLSTVISPTEDVIVSTATGGANEESPTGVTISDSDTATITRTLLSVVKTAPATAEVGDTINYQFTVTNNGATPIALDGLEDQLPAGFSFVAVALTVNGATVPLTEGVDYTVSAGGLLQLTPTDVSIPAGGVATVTVTGVITL